MDSSQYDRVTSVLAPFSGLDKINPEILKNAADRGTLVHKMCDALIEGVGIDDMGIEGYMDSFKSWYVDHVFVDKPSRWYCEELMITGECDALYDNGDGLTLVDFKTPLRESKTWVLQASAYHYLGCKAGLHIANIEFVRLKKDGKSPQVISYNPDMDTFMKCLEIYRMFFKNKSFHLDLDYL